MKLVFLLSIGLFFINLSLAQDRDKNSADANLDKALVVMLDSIYEEDQKYRLQIDEFEQKYSWDSKEMQALFQLIHEKDSVNVIKVTKILDQRGWLGPDIVGQQGNATLFLVIQHADFNTQKKYLPMMRKAVKLGNARTNDLALLEDRVAIRAGKKQKYGSQIGRNELTGEFYVMPLRNPKNVNKRRAKMGLGSLDDYISIWGLKWDAQEYIKTLPQIIAMHEDKE